LISKIINMAERMKDAEDRLLESMFDSSPVADNGFSASVVGKVRRRVWLRRLTLPAFAILGGAVAVKPLAALLMAVTSLSSLVPRDVVNSALALVPQAQTIVLGAMLLAACMLALRTIED